MYISKGTVISPSTEGLLFVVRGGVKFQLTGQEAALWLNGRFQFVDEKTEDERRCLKKLKRMGLAEMICTPKVRHIWRCIFLWAKQGEKTKRTRQNSKSML